MKIAAFVASHSHNGNTATAAKQLLKGAEDAGAETKICYLFDYNIKPCRGCRVCEQTNKCVIKGDDVPQLHEVIDWADAFVLGTPTFYGDIVGQFKQFVDRCYPYVLVGKDPVTHKMTFGSTNTVRRPGVLIPISGNHGPRVFESHLKVGYFCFNDLNVYPWREVLITKTSWKNVADQPSTMEELYKTGQDLVKHMECGGTEDSERTKKFYDRYRLLEDVDVPSFENVFPKEDVFA